MYAQPVQPLLTVVAQSIQTAVEIRVMPAVIEHLPNRRRERSSTAHRLAHPVAIAIVGELHLASVMSIHLAQEALAGEVTVMVARLLAGVRQSEAGFGLDAVESSAACSTFVQAIR